MAAGNYDFYIEQGATFNQTFIWKDSTGALVNLTGYTARMQVRQTVANDTVLLSLTTENGRISLGGSAGTIALTLDAATSAGITFARGVYDLELVHGGVVTRLLEGQVDVSKEVTR